MNNLMWGALTVAMSGVAAASVHPTQVEQRLAFIIGNWTIAGWQAKYQDDCQWFDNRSFVVCDTRDARQGTPHRSIAVIGWSAADRHYTYQQYDDRGRARAETCFQNEQAGLTCLGERRASDGLTQTRTHITPVAGGLALRQDKSVNAGPWTEVGQLKYVTRKCEVNLPPNSRLGSAGKSGSDAPESVSCAR